MQGQYNAMAAGQYMGAASPQLSPGSAHASSFAGPGVLMGGKPAAGAAAAQQFSPAAGVSVRGLGNPDGSSVPSSVWQQQMQLQHANQGSALGAAATSMQLPQDPLLQQFQQLSVGRGALTPSSYEAVNAGMAAPMQVQPQQYGVPQMLYGQPGMQQGWTRQQQQQQAQVQYGLPQYGAPGLDPLQQSPAAASLQQQQAPTSPIMSQILEGQMDPAAFAMQQQQHLAPGGAFGSMQGMGQPWAPAGMVFSTKDATNAALLAAGMPSTSQAAPYAGNQPYGPQDGW
jgi:hypothetical protein